MDRLTPLRLGVDVLFDGLAAGAQDLTALLAGKRVGLITNPTGVDSRLVSIVERFRERSNCFSLVALFGPEHGVRGNAQAGEFVGKYHDPHLGDLPVFSLYGQALHSLAQPEESPLENIDATMRSFDTQHSGKQVEAGMLDGIDVLVFDLQDVGTRVYTYVATMAYAMHAAAAAGIDFVVLDRPNPITGSAASMEGPTLDFPRLSSFIGLYPTPCRHSMTIGELARYFNAEFAQSQPARLTVVPMQGWTRELWYDELSTAASHCAPMPFVMPSPNMPTLDTAIVYPGMVMLEGTNLSEGRGTTRPFELFGAPWIDGYVLSRDLNAMSLPGVLFRESWFTPTFSKFAGERCGGCQLHVTDRHSFRPVSVALAILATIKTRYGLQSSAPDAEIAVPSSHGGARSDEASGLLSLFPDYFDRVLGNAAVREALERGDSHAAMVASWAADIVAFERRRTPYLLY